MISPLKLKIISWYTCLVALILISVFALLYALLWYQMNKELEHTTIERIKLVEQQLVNSREHHASRHKRGPVDIAKSNVFNRNIRDFTDGFDDRCLVAIYRENQLQYLTKRYKYLESEMHHFAIPPNIVTNLSIGSTTFKMTSLTWYGQTFFLGYALTDAKNVLSHIVQLFIIIFPFGIVLSILVGYWVTQRSLNIIHKVTQTVDQITSKNMHQRILIPKGKDEITELIHTLNAMIDRLESSFIAARQFSHDAAHELRTPLTVLRGELEALLDQPVRSADMRQSLESMLEEIQYLARIADKLLLLHNFDTGRIEYHFTLIDLCDLVRETGEDAEILGKGKNVHIELVTCESLQIRGNHELLQRLLWNLIDNAIKYTPEGGKITISLNRRNQHAAITVFDTGIGIEDTEQEKIFERFYRVDKSRSRRIGGSGLGLSICRQIVERHAGSIEVKSRLGHGTTFLVQFPLVQE